MFRISLISLILTLAFIATQAHSQVSAPARVLAIQQAEISNLKKQSSDANQKISDLKVVTDDLTKKITDLNTKIANQATEISNLQNKIETTALTFTRIGATPSTGIAACQAVGKECFISYGPGDTPYVCSHFGAWKRVLCSAPF